MGLAGSCVAGGSGAPEYGSRSASAGMACVPSSTAATPFPALPLDLTWRLSSRWAASAQAAYLKVNTHDLGGWYLDTHADIQYRWVNNFVVGAGYASIRTDLTHRNGSFPGVVNLSISGPQLFARFSF